MMHTPGPWKWSVDDPQVLILHAGKDYIGNTNILHAERCRACADRDARCGWPKEEDARLIAAAPDLMAALEKAPKPMTSLTAKELKDNWKAVDHWFAVYDAWMDDIAKQALAQVGKSDG